MKQETRKVEKTKVDVKLAKLFLQEMTDEHLATWAKLVKQEQERRNC